VNPERGLAKINVEKFAIFGPRIASFPATIKAAPRSTARRVTTLRGPLRSSPGAHSMTPLQTIRKFGASGLDRRMTTATDPPSIAITARDRGEQRQTATSL